MLCTPRLPLLLWREGSWAGSNIVLSHGRSLVCYTTSSPTAIPVPFVLFCPPSALTRNHCHTHLPSSYALSRCSPLTRSRHGFPEAKTILSKQLAFNYQSLDAPVSQSGSPERAGRVRSVPKVCLGQRHFPGKCVSRHRSRPE